MFVIINITILNMALHMHYLFYLIAIFLFYSLLNFSVIKIFNFIFINRGKNCKRNNIVNIMLKTSFYYSI
jgi:hypothetical protein